MTTHDELRYLSETEARGRVLRWEGTPRGRSSVVRWLIVGYCRRRPRYVAYAEDTTGQVGNRFIILERLDDHSASQPVGTRRVVSKESFPAQGYVLEPQEWTS